MKDLKVVFIGRSGVGKTTLYKVFFEQHNPIDLLLHSLEPTINYEIYNPLNNNFRIFDLAGQQIEEWFSTSEDSIFKDTNIIYLILDLTEDLDVNYSLLENTIKIRNLICPNANLIVFFHKMDLVDDQKINEIKKRNIKYQDINNLSIFFTSIEKEFLFNTFSKFIKSFRKLLNSDIESNFKDLIIKADILNSLYSKNKFFIEDYIKENDISVNQLNRKLEELNNAGFINIISPSNFQLEEKTGDLFKVIEKKLHIKIIENLQDEESQIKSIIISDRYGKLFISYEYKEEFLKDLNRKRDYNFDPSLVSMFFSAIYDFGFSFEEGSFNSIDFAGLHYNLIFFSFEDYYILFIIDKITPLELIEWKENLKTIFIKLKKEFKKSFDYFKKTGSIYMEKELKDKLIELVNKFNNIEKNKN